MEYIFFVLGFFILIFGAEWLIEGASVLAKRIGISDLIVGLTVVAFGTSLPELIVNLFANTGTGGLAIGNVVGSNIANILLILGVASIIHPLTVHRTTVWREILFNIFAAAMLAVLVSERLLSAGGFNGLDRIDGIILMSYFVMFLYYTFGKTSLGNTKEKASEKNKTQDETENFNIGTLFLKMAGGMAGLYFGGKWIVDGAISIAEVFGASEAFIGLTIVAIGTSLPELAASIIAVKNKKVDIAVGNAVGSNLFNIFWVLGLSAYIKPLPFSDSLFQDVIIMLAVAVALFLVMILGKTKHQINKTEGIIFVSLYALYLLNLHEQ